MKNAIKAIAAVAAFVFAFAAQAATQKVGDYTWTYRIEDGMAEIYNEGNTAISPYPEGDITIPSTLGGKPVVRIGDAAMSYLRLLTSVTIPNSVTSIGENAFYSCSGLESVEMPGVKEIDANAFCGCTSLSSIVLSDDVKILGAGAFAGCPGDENGLVIFNNVVYGGSYDIPSRVVIPDTVTRIADYALSRFYRLKSVLIPGNVKSIGEYAFCESDLGEGVVICDGVEDIGTGAFYNTGLKSIVIPGSVNSIGESAFFRSESLTSATILDGVRTIGDDAFRCYCLTSVSIPPSVTTIGSGGIYVGVKTVYVAAGDADRVKEVLPIPDTQLVGIDFVEPSGAYTVTLNANGGVCGAPSVKVKKGAAAGDLPAAARKDYAFAGWYTAASGGGMVTESTPVNGNVTLYAHWLPAPGGELCEKVNGYTWYFRVGDDGNAEIYPGGSGYAVEPLPSGALAIPAKLGGLDVTSIGEYAFSGCSELTSVTIPASVTGIGYCAFYVCNSLTSLTIPDSVASIGNCAFSHCESLTSVSLPARFKDNLDASVFDGCPEGLKITYRSASSSIWTLKYHSNNGKNDLDTQSFNVGEAKRLYYMNSRLGWEYKDEDGFNYVFLGWAKSPTGAVFYENGELVKDLAAAGKVMHIYAVWQKRAYEVCFHSNDEDGLVEYQEFRPNIAKNLYWLDSGLGWTRPGYDFLGWAKAPTSTAVVYKNGESVKNLVAQGQTLHLYAVWRDRRWTIRFHRNYSSGDSTYEDQKIPVGASVKLLWLDSQLKWTRDGYWFKGWAKSRTAGAAYANGETVKDLVPGGQVLHLYGAWGQKTK